MPINRLLPIVYGQLTGDEIFLGVQHKSFDRRFLPNNVSLTLGGLYRSPSANKAESTRSIVDFIQKVCAR